MKIEICHNIGEINEDMNEMEVQYSSDGWDSYSKWLRDMKATIKGNCDPILEDVRLALKEKGFELLEKGHEFIEEEETIIYKIQSIPSHA